MVGRFCFIVFGLGVQMFWGMFLVGVCGRGVGLGSFVVVVWGLWGCCCRIWCCFVLGRGLWG